MSSVVVMCTVLAVHLHRTNDRNPEELFMQTVSTSQTGTSEMVQIIYASFLELKCMFGVQVSRCAVDCNISGTA